MHPARPQRQEWYAFAEPASSPNPYGPLMAHPFHRAPSAERGFGGGDSAADTYSETPDELESPVSGGGGDAARQGEVRGGETGWARFVRGRCCLL